MTKPADERTAKAREQIKERLEAFAGQWIASRTVYDDFEMTVDFAESERKEVREECARVVDAAEKSWRDGGCLENGCACWTEHVKNAIRALGER